MTVEKACFACKHYQNDHVCAVGQDLDQAHYIIVSGRGEAVGDECPGFEVLSDDDVGGW